MASKSKKRSTTGSSRETTGGGEFSEGGGSGRSSTGTGTSTGNYRASGKSEESSSASEESSAKSGRYSLDCATAGEGCSLKLSGTYDEVLSAGVEHGRSAHGMKGSDDDISEDIKGYIKEDTGVSEMPGTFQGRGQSQSGVSPSRPS